MMMGHGVTHLLDKGLAATGGLPPEGVHEALVKAFLEYYEAHIAVHSRPFPGVAETLTILRDAGHRLAVCTTPLLSIKGLISLIII